MAKIVCSQTCEQGLGAKLGGSFKLYAGTEHQVESLDNGAAFVLRLNGRTHTVPKTIIDKMVGLGYIQLLG